MPIHSLSFIFFFLPASLIVYYIVPNRFKSTVALGISFCFYTLLEPKYLFLLIGSLLFDYLTVQLFRLYDKRERIRKLLVVAAIVKSIGLIVFFGARMQIAKHPAPFGLSIYQSTSLGYILELYKRRAAYETNFIRFGLFCSFFPKLYTGPLVQYNQAIQELRHPSPSFSMIGRGMVYFIQGLAKKVLLADGLMQLYQTLKAYKYYELTTASVWLLLAASLFGICMTLSAYSDMARGLGLLFSMDTPKNMFYPLESKSVDEFFSRFNITINRFIRRYVYVNLGEDRYGPVSNVLNILLVSMLMGVWFGITVNHMLWGAYLAFFVLVEKYFLRRYLEQIPGLFSRLYTIFVLILSFAVFSGNTLAQSLFYLRTMFGMSGLPVFDDKIIYLFSSSYVLLLGAAFLSFSFVRSISNVVKKKTPQIFAVVSFAGNTALLFVCIAMILAA